MKLIAITGGIGSGKSVVCRILSVLGYDVYDCDSRAKAIMDVDTDIKRQIAERITPDALLTDHTLDRRRLADVVFNSPEKLAALNQIVHHAVRQNIINWSKTLSGDLAFVETAILYQSGLDKMVDAVWDVEAPEQVRIERVCLRNGLTPEQVQSRIRSQHYQPAAPHPVVCPICNDGCHSLLRQIHRLLDNQCPYRQ